MATLRGRGPVLRQGVMAYLRRETYQRLRREHADRGRTMSSIVEEALRQRYGLPAPKSDGGLFSAS